MDIRLNKRGAAGVTLIELLVAVALVAVILTAVNYLFSGAMTMFDQAQTRINMSMEARAIFGRLGRDLQGAVALDTDRNGVPDSYFIGSETGLAFVGRIDYPASTGSEQGLDVCEVRYKYDPPAGARPGRLFYKRRTEKTADATNGFPVESSWSPGANETQMDLLAWSLKSFKIGYAGSLSGNRPNFSSNAWTLSEANGLPLAVKIELELEDRTTRLKKTFVRVIWIPGGRTGG